jgi:hypothetical protein
MGKGEDKSPTEADTSPTSATDDAPSNVTE